jgi:alpha-L-fucosidase
MCETLNDHWGVADDLNYKPVKRLIEEICACRKVGANMLLNVGPNGDGSLPLMAKAIMEAIGRWMSIYGRAIYNGRPYIAEDGKKDFVLRDAADEKTFYLFKHDLGVGGDSNVTLETCGSRVAVLSGFEGEIERVRWMDDGKDLDFSFENGKLSVACTDFIYGQNLCVRVAEIKTK